MQFQATCVRYIHAGVGNQGHLQAHPISLPELSGYLVRLEQRIGGKMHTVGSGTFIAPTLIATARHILITTDGHLQPVTYSGYLLNLKVANPRDDVAIASVEGQYLLCQVLPFFTLNAASFLVACCHNSSIR